MSGPDRYEGKPFLRLVDGYILWLIGPLDPAFDSSMQQTLPALNATFGLHAESWHEVVRIQMDFTPEDDAMITSRWQEQVGRDLAEGRQPDPVAWAYMVADWFTED